MQVWGLIRGVKEDLFKAREHQRCVVLLRGGEEAPEFSIWQNSMDAPEAVQSRELGSCEQWNTWPCPAPLCTPKNFQSRCLLAGIYHCHISSYNALPVSPGCVPELGTAHRTGKEMGDETSAQGIDGGAFPEQAGSLQDLCSWKSRTAFVPALGGDGHWQ